MNFSFAGCGFLGIYHVGVASCLKQHAPHLIENGKFLGASAGAIVSTCLLCDCCLGECTSFTLRLATKARSKSLGPLHPSFNITRILRQALHEVLPDNAHEIAAGKLFISLTRVSDRQAVLVSEFESKAELIQALLCSAHVPFYSGLIPPAYRGTRYVDGGLSDNLPILNEDTVTVSPFSGESDICPSDVSSNFEHIILANTSMQCTSQNLYRLSRALFPPHPETLSDMCKQGFDDCLKFLQRNNLISCTRHLSVRSSVMPVGDIYSHHEKVTSHLEDSCDETDSKNEEHCDDCRRKVQGALQDSLPTKVADEFQVACAHADQGLQSYIRRSPALRIASTLVASWFLPADIAYNFTIRILEYLPSLPQDVREAWSEFYGLLQRIANHIYHNKRRYTARFSCQLAITEVNYGQHVTQPKSIAASPFEPPPVEPLVRNLNIGFAVDFESKSENPIHNLKQLENMEIEDIQLETRGRDEDNPQCYNFQEIYDIDDVDVNIPSPTKLNESYGQDLSWDDYLEYKPEVETEVEELVQDILSLPHFNEESMNDYENKDALDCDSRKRENR
ncbi:hypothetical protein FSP39_002246 [Pinctada imbricata]|uniref:triacylglycerol lipase n=1 Tax=Pinctada imbricata TaxID=66713 RepID=A0AA89C0I2_PINIB|nr:hypothetical protein FSP39_002246 [Pinctada imbricata]